MITNFTAVAATFNNIGPGLELVGPTETSEFLHGIEADTDLRHVGWPSGDLSLVAALRERYLEEILTLSEKSPDS